MPVFTDVMPDHALWLVEKAANLNTNPFGDFVDRWMELPEQTRRVWSYNGAVTSRLGDPLHYHCPYAWANYFDPSNWGVYPDHEHHVSIVDGTSKLEHEDQM